MSIGATHTTDKAPKYLEDCDVQAVAFPLLHPETVQSSRTIDNIISKTVYSATPRTRLAGLINAVPYLGAALIRLKRRYF